MASVTRAPDRYAIYYAGNWDDWTGYSGSQTLTTTGEVAYELQYVNDSSAVATGCTFTVSITPGSPGMVGNSVAVHLYDRDPTDPDSRAIAYRKIDISNGSGRYTVTFNNLDAATNKIYFTLNLYNDNYPATIENGISIKVDYFIPAASTGTPSEPVSVSKSGAESIPFSWTYSGNGTQTKAELQWKTSSGDWQSLGTVNGSGTSVSAAAYKFPVGSISWRVRVTNSYGIVGNWSSAASFTVSYAALGVDASPASVYTGETETITLSNRLSRTVTLAFTHSGNAVCPPVTVAANRKTVTPTEAWFTAAGVTGNSMSVTVTATDDLGRTATDSFTVKKPTGSTGTPTEPLSVTKSGASAITFAWSYSGDGTQTKAELQWKTSSGDWQSLGTVSGSGTSYTAAAYRFPVGSISWRVRVTNSYGIVGSWSSAASFTVSYAALSAAVSPASIYVDNNGTLTITNRLNRQLTIVYKHNSTELAPAQSVSSNSVTVTPKAAWFETAGVSGSSLSVTAAISDDLGRTATASFTAINPQGSTATPTSPKNTTVDGAAPVRFAWTVSSDWGTQTKAELQHSTDGATWSSLGEVNGSGTTWSAPAVAFPSGTNYWRVRVKNSFGVLGDWSSSASFTVKYSAQSQVVPVNSPTSGVISASSAQSFAVTLEASSQVYAPFTVAAATFYWRSGTSGDFTAVSMTASGSGASVTIAAGTFPSGTIQWYAEATDNTGRTTETEIYTLSAAVSVVDMTPRRPINTVESGSGPIVFEIGFISLDGKTPPSGKWSYSYDGEEWHTYTTTLLEDRHEDYLDITIPAGFFHAGTVYWKARAQNSEGVWGDWSEVVSFAVLAAPNVEGVTGDGKPFLTVTWQADGQVAYEVKIDGISYGPYFGEAVRSFSKENAPCSNGQHTVAVRAQNRYGLWSEWTEATVEVANNSNTLISSAASETADKCVLIEWPTAETAPVITRQPQGMQSTESWIFQALTQIAPRAADWRLEKLNTSTGLWEEVQTGTTIAGIVSATVTASAAAEGQYRAYIYNYIGGIYTDAVTFAYDSPDATTSPLKEGIWYGDAGWFFVYRDNQLIAKTYKTSYLDRTAAPGTHTWYVVQRVKDGYYRLVRPAALTVEIDSPMIAALEGGDFFPLCLSDTAEAACEIRRSVNTVRTWYSGARFPSVEIGEEETLSASFSSFWLDYDSENADKLEALLGKAVILKLPHNRVIVGVLDSLPGADESYRRGYTLTIEQMEWEDLVDET